MVVSFDLEGSFSASMRKEREIKPASGNPWVTAATDRSCFYLRIEFPLTKPDGNNSNINGSLQPTFSSWWCKKAQVEKKKTQKSGIVFVLTVFPSVLGDPTTFSLIFPPSAFIGGQRRLHSLS